MNPVDSIKRVMCSWTDLQIHSIKKVRNELLKNKKSQEFLDGFDCACNLLEISKTKL